MNRRNLLKAIPALSVACVLPATAFATSIPSCMLTFEEYREMLCGMQLPIPDSLQIAVNRHLDYIALHRPHSPLGRLING